MILHTYASDYIRWDGDMWWYYETTVLDRAPGNVADTFLPLTPLPLLLPPPLSLLSLTVSLCLCLYHYFPLISEGGC